MSKVLATKNVAAVLLGAAMILAVGFAFATPVKAQSVGDLQAQIQALLAQIAALQGGSTPSGACFTFTRSHSMGESGGEVMWIQKFLNGHGAVVATVGAGSPGNESAYFGAKTKAAVAKFQAMNGISPAAGFWGPITRAKANSMCAAMPSPTPTPTPPGTPSPSPSGPVSLSGGAGSVESYSEMSGLSNEQVGEDEEDVEVAGLEIEVDDGSDILLTAVRLDFSTQPGNDDLGDFITEVALMLDGKEIARVDADEFNDDNDWTKTVTISRSNNAVIRAGDTGELTVGLTGVSNIDTGDAEDDWGLDFVSVRFEDAQGASVTENTNTDAFTFDVRTFASAAAVELEAQLSDDTPEGVVNVDDEDDTDNVPLLRFTLEAEGGDISLNDLPITFATTTGNTGDTLAEIASSVHVTIGGETFSESTSGSAVSLGSAGATVTFDDIDVTIDEGEEVTVVVSADINDTEGGAFVDGDQLTASFTASNRNAMDAEDETGEELAQGDKTGTASGEAIAFYDVGIKATFVSADEMMTPGADGTADDDTATLKLVFDIEAFDGTVYVSNNATPTIAADGAVTAIDVDDGGILYRYEVDGVATTANISDVVSKSNTTGTVDDQQVSGADGGEYTFEDGEKARITVTVTRANSTANADSDGFHDLQLVAIGWSTTNEDDTMNVYEFDLEDFKTDPIFVN